MYESPISITEKIAHEIANENDNQIFKAIAQIVVDVDKDEIIKALQYDRGQYEKGYRDGLEAAVVHAHWDHGDVIGRGFIGDALVSTIYDWWKCSNCGYKVENCNAPQYSYCPHCGAKMDEEVSE